MRFEKKTIRDVRYESQSHASSSPGSTDPKEGNQLAKCEKIAVEMSKSKTSKILYDNNTSLRTCGCGQISAWPSPSSPLSTSHTA